jgi:hypothetical protein
MERIMDKIIEEAMKAVPCAARLGYLCDTPHKHWSPCCRLHMAIKCEGQPIQVDYLPDSNEYHILIYKRPEGVRESYGCVSLIEPEWDQDWNIRLAGIKFKQWKKVQANLP